MKEKDKNRIEIEFKYIQLMEDVKTNEYYTRINLTNRTNVYTCKNGHLTKTRDIDAGVTPFMHECKTCGEIATSSFYTDTHPELQPVQEWYRPSLEEVLRMSEGMREHILSGGLDVRDIK